MREGTDVMATVLYSGASVIGKEEILFEKNEVHYLITDGQIQYGGKNSNNQRGIEQSF